MSRPRSSELDRFWSHVDKDDPNGCWIWTGTKFPNGYGMFCRWDWNGENEKLRRLPCKLTHRFAWELLVGSIPDRIEVCHNCPNGDRKDCLNPDHMFLGTRTDNAQDAIKKGIWNPKWGSAPRVNSAKTHCPSGHPYDETNTYVTSQGYRLCKTCHRLRARQRKLTLCTTI